MHRCGPLGLVTARGFVGATTHSTQAFYELLQLRFPKWWSAVWSDSGERGADGWNSPRDRLRASGLAATDVPSVYIGFDPTADSLHVGNLLQMSALRALQASAFRPLVLIGGATGMIGDPSGRSSERNLMQAAELEHNVAGIQRSLSRIVDFDCDTTGAVMVNNADFYDAMPAVDFIRDIGRHFRVSSMLGKDSVKSRLDSGSGLSFTEFSYQLFQANDFLQLHSHHQCVLQVGGADQWGNITAGIDLIRRATGNEAMGLTIPLLLTPAGEKYGKSAGNAVWINPDKTSSYALYQHFLNATDGEVESLLRLFTTLAQEELEDIAARHAAEPHARHAQRALAEAVTLDVRGATGVASAVQASSIMFGGSLEGMTAQDVTDVAAEVPTAELPRDDIVGVRVVDLAVAAGAIKSKAEARRLASSGGLYVNNERVTEPQATVAEEMLIDGSVLLLRTGKRRITVVRVAA